jgi:hypothetical protein
VPPPSDGSPGAVDDAILQRGGVASSHVLEEPTATP